jgi:hypothetical protein
VSAFSGLYTPKQLGPTIRMPFSPAISTIRSSQSAPSAEPLSLKPAVRICTARTPFSAQSVTACTVYGAATATIAISTSPGMSCIRA